MKKVILDGSLNNDKFGYFNGTYIKLSYEKGVLKVEIINCFNRVESTFKKKLDESIFNCVKELIETQDFSNAVMGWKMLDLPQFDKDFDIATHSLVVDKDFKHG